MRTVAIVGRNPLTMPEAKLADVDELWGPGIIYNDLKVDRIYEIHPFWMVQNENYYEKHWEWMTNPNREEELWVLDHDPQVQNVREYPAWYAARLTENLRTTSNQPMRIFTSSFDFMLAHAILERVDEVHIYGFDITVRNTEYYYQVPGLSFWTGFALGQGTRIRIPDKSPLLKQSIYAWESGGQMVGRHSISKRLERSRQERDKYIAQVNFLRGALQQFTATIHNPTPEDIKTYESLQSQLDSATAEFNYWNGAHVELESLRDECDFGEPENLDLRNPFENKKFMSKNEAEKLTHEIML